MEVSVLERQQARLSWLWLLQQHNYDDLQNNLTQFLPLHEVNSNNMMTQEMSSESNKVNGTGNDMESFGNVMVSWNLEDKGEDIAMVKNMESVDSRNKSKKRKAGAIIAEKSSDKCIKRDAEKKESKVKEKGNKEASPDTSKGNSELPEVKKPDYVHVRARRGEATDSHSLAERARREKISKKMKCLQDLVPGCNKAMGKAGILDEIINYVQSLQRQVEFLSMKLTALNPRDDLKFDDLVAKEFPACVSKFQAATSSPAIASLAFNQLYPVALDISSLRNSTQEASEQILRPSMPFPEFYLDPTHLPQVQHLPMCDNGFLGISMWDSIKE